MYTAHATHAHRAPHAAGRPQRGADAEIERFTVGERRVDVVGALEVLDAAPEHPYVLALPTTPTPSRVAVPHDLLGTRSAAPTAKSSDPPL